jgi:hypothetical protein
MRANGEIAVMVGYLHGAGKDDFFDSTPDESSIATDEGETAILGSRARTEGDSALQACVCGFIRA